MISTRWLWAAWPLSILSALGWLAIVGLTYWSVFQDDLGDSFGDFMTLNVMFVVILSLGAIGTWAGYTGARDNETRR